MPSLVSTRRLAVVVLVLTLVAAAPFALGQRIEIPPGFPNADTTGCSGPLTPSSGITVTVDGMVVENLDISGGVQVQADNVTIRNCRITGGLYGVNNSGIGTLIEDCTIFDGESKGILGSNMTVRRCNISQYKDSIAVNSNVLIEDCWLHDPKVGPETHNDGVQSVGGSNVTIRHCTVQSQYQNQTSCFIFQAQYDVIDNILFENNFLSGGSYCIYLRDKGTGFGDPTNARVIHNMFEWDSYAYGPLSTNGDGITYSGNIYHTGEALWVNPALNWEPVAVVGSDLRIADADGDGFESVVMDASGSVDFDGEIVSYAWYVDDSLVSSDAQTTLNLPVGEHAVTLALTDNDDALGLAVLTVTVYDLADNIVPVVLAGDDLLVYDEDYDGVETVTLDGSDSYDLDGEIVSFAWSEDGQALASTGAVIELELSVGVHTLTLSATDNDGGVSTDTVIVEVDDALSSILFDATSSTSGGGSELSWTHTLGGGTNRALVVAVGAEDGEAANFQGVSVAFNGAAMTPVEGSLQVSGSGTRTGTQLFYLLEADLPEPGDYVVTVVRAGAVDNQAASATSLKNVAQQAPEAVATNSGLAAAVSTELVTLSDGAWIIDVVSHRQGGVWTPTAQDQERRWSITLGSSAGYAGSTRRVDEAGAAEMAWSFSGKASLLSASLAAFAPVARLVEGDADGDGHVNINDFIILKRNYNIASGATLAQGDFNRDGAVDIADFVILKRNYGR